MSWVLKILLISVIFSKSTPPIRQLVLEIRRIWFEGNNYNPWVVSEEKYKGNGPFDILLIKYYLPSGPIITLMKKDGQYQYVQDKLILTYTNQTVKDQLEEIWQNVLKMHEDWSKDMPPSRPKWKSIKATVTHDPNNFGKAYLVQRVEFTI